MRNSFVRHSAHWMVVFLLCAATACGGDSGTNGGGDNGDGGGGDDGDNATTSVSVGDNFFNPSGNIVSGGATVTWTWTGSNSHNVTFASSTIASSNTQSSGTFSTTMPTTAGAYSYMCTIHGSGMSGTVTVQ